TFALALHELATNALKYGRAHHRARAPEREWRTCKATVQTFALALHELATNALKYGRAHHRARAPEREWRT
ncbi:histidine kinase, partial [Methylobacterium radiotolerans]